MRDPIVLTRYEFSSSGLFLPVLPLSSTSKASVASSKVIVLSRGRSIGSRTPSENSRGKNLEITFANCSLCT